MDTEAEKKIMDYKKERFLFFVDGAAGNLGFSTPKVKFWKNYENHFKDGERAHIHLEKNLICIAEPELKIMDEDDIKETASHEVSHLVYEKHSTDFYNLQIGTKAGYWKPPAGSVGALPESYALKKEKKDKRKERPVKYKCNYHICGKKTKTARCKYCKEYFCKEHIKPREPGFDRRQLDDETNSHPCLGYWDYLKKEKQEQEKEFFKALDKMSTVRKRIKQRKINEVSNKPSFFKRLIYSIRFKLGI